MIPFAANAVALCCSDGCTKDCQCFWMARTTPENCSFLICTAIKYMVSWAHQSSSKTTGQLVQPFSTAHRIVSHYFTMRRYVFPQKLSLPFRGSVFFQGISRLVLWHSKAISNSLGHNVCPTRSTPPTAVPLARQPQQSIPHNMTQSLRNGLVF